MGQALTSESDGFAAALEQARVLEAAHRDSIYAFADAKTLRLGILKDEIEAVIAGNDDARRAFDIAAYKGPPPRLFLDLTASVVMEPDPKTYRLLSDTAQGSQILLETEDCAAMVKKVQEILAISLIEKRRNSAFLPPVNSQGGNASPAALTMAWLTGAVIGALALASAVIYLNMLRF
ncbi:hypothetical protein [Aestuariivirga sp.]|uniref:hypothetical protein n=1 Tax=Aestuariivirga sp. TaxID=2650926 RepID=UPI0039E40C80